jgi:molybdopterin converting factor small subunit
LTPTVFGLIEAMTNTYGEKFRLAILDASGKELPVIVMKNDQEIEFLQGLGTPLRNGDRVMFLPPVAGG